jgi:phosphate-selective porin OprO/OprP
MRVTRWPKALGLSVLAAAFLLLSQGQAKAEEKAVEDLKATLEAMKARLERLEQQNEELRRGLPGGGTPTSGPAPEPGQEKSTSAPEPSKEKINAVIDSYLKEKESKKKADDEKQKAEEKQKLDLKEAEGYKVGSETALTARWNLDQGLLFETKNRDFWAHIGYFMQWDTVSFTQSPQLKPANQLGRFSDGTYFRRIRPLWDGQAWGFVEWNVILALEQIGDVSAPNGTPAGNGNALINLDEVWAGVYGVPLIGRIRAGHLKVCQGLEGNQWSSSRAMTFMENAAYTDAFYTIFGTGVQIANSTLDDGRGDRVTWQAMVYRDDFLNAGLFGANTGAHFGDGEFSYAARITALPFAECEDHHLLHLGLSYSWRRAENVQGAPGLGTVGPPMVRFRARPEQRDAFGGLGDNATGPGDTGRLIDTGTVIASAVSALGTELWYIRGPFSVMAEWAFASIIDAQVPVGTGARRRVITGDRNFNGGYVTLSYFLTGETRLYDRTYGREGTFYVERPFTNAFAKVGEDGHWLLGLGAWEVAARLSYVNLNDGPIDGGVFLGFTAGLNWYLASNLKVQMEYLTNERYDKLSGANGNRSGVVQGFGTRMQFQF